MPGVLCAPGFLLPVYSPRVAEALAKAGALV